MYGGMWHGTPAINFNFRKDLAQILVILSGLFTRRHKMF